MDYDLDNYPHAVEVMNQISTALISDPQHYPISIDFSSIPKADLDFFKYIF